MKNIYENPEIQSLNRLPMRSHLIPFADQKMAVNECAAGPENLEFTNSPFVKRLDGKWSFTLLENPSVDEENKDIRWSEINVPGTWTLQGFDKPHYTNVQMPFDTLPPFVPKENPTGVYKLKVELPAEWDGRRVVLHVGSAESVLIVYADGEQVGISKDTRLPCEFDLTPYVYGKTAVELKLKVIRYSDASFVEDQDQWWFGGIHRSVYLYTTEDFYIADVEALTKLEGAGPVIAADCDPIKNAYHEDENVQSYVPGCNSDGIIPLYVTLGHTDSASITSVLHDSPVNAILDKEERVIKYSVYELNGTVQKPELGKEVAAGYEVGSYNLRKTLNQVRIQIRIKNPRLWNHETPNLYVVSVSLHESKKGKAGRLIETTAFTTGFKAVQIKGRELLINGKKVFIKGVNRHEHSEYNGKTLSTEEMVRDLHIMKSYNFNAVRTCHYPDDERWYELCNRYGMYVLDEANIENHAYYDVIPRWDAYTNAYMQRVQRMVRRDKNNVCIFGWSLGNESGDGQNQLAAQAWVRRVDHTRLVHYEGFVRAAFTQADFTLDSLARGKGLSDFIGPMYPSIDLISEYVRTRDDYRPLIMCEYSHAMGNANGSLADYWRAIYNLKGLQGGFIWDWIDQGLAAEAPAGTAGKPQGGKYWKYGGDFGDSPADYDFCLNGLMFPDQTPKPAMEECRKVFAPVYFRTISIEEGKFEVQNRFDFSGLDNVKMTWKILCNGTTVNSGTKSLAECKLGQMLPVNIPTGQYVLGKDGQYVLNVEFSYAKENFFAPKDWVFGREQVVLNSGYFENTVYKVEEAAKNPACEFEFLSKICETIKPNVFRPLTENECVKRELPTINNEPTPFSFINKPTRSWINADLPGSVCEKTKDGFVINTGSKAKKKQKLADVKITKEEVVSPVNTKALKITAQFELTDSLPEYPKAGIELKIPCEFSNVSWYGAGPCECYSDRKDGALFGMHTLPAEKMEVPYIVPQENGSRCETSYICLYGSNGRKLQIQSSIPISFNYTPYEYSDLWKCEHHNELVNTSMGKNGYFTLHLDAALRGVGTGACGPDTLPKYKVLPGTYSLEVIIY